MRALLVCYDLGVPESSEDYQKIADYIDTFPDWCKPLQSQWIVLSDGKSVSDVRNDLMTLTDTNDKILVIDITDDLWASARLKTSVADWLKAKV
ncbi:MAG: hypothetical protein HGA33_04225 [Candidatus Moranbacteria bacterium]|nr:hypothetical protein [Candidatus Moranbacteria bacterium]